MEHVIIIGGGVGGALAHDLTLRGFKVTLLEKGALLSGTTGRHHGLLHSGARYVLHDTATARECMEENRILRRIAPDALEQNDGLFVAISDEDMDYREQFMEGCRAAGIEAAGLRPEQALQREPNLNPDLKWAVRVPDATMDAWRLPLHFFATASAHGADIRTHCEVVEILSRSGAAVGVKFFDYRTHRTETLNGDIVVNAAGPWAGRIAAMLDIPVPLRPGPGVMVSVSGRLTDMVINRLHPAGEGDIIVPQRRLSLLGTSAWLAQDPDDIDVPPAHVERIIALTARLLPEVRHLPVHAAWSAARPLIVRDADTAPTKISRGFECVDHARRDGVQGFVSLLGGKATTMRAMAEKAADLVCEKTGRTAACRTRETRLLHYRRFYNRN